MKLVFRHLAKDVNTAILVDTVVKLPQSATLHQSETVLLKIWLLLLQLYRRPTLVKCEKVQLAAKDVGKVLDHLEGWFFLPSPDGLDDQLSGFSLAESRPLALI